MSGTTQLLHDASSKPILESAHRLAVSEAEILIIFILPFFLTLFFFKVYQWTLHPDIKLFKDFRATAFISLIISSSVALVMLIIGTNLARAFTLLGIFSVLRFRNTGKTMMPLLFIIVSIVIGITTGLTHYLIAVQFTIFISIVVAVMNIYERFSGGGPSSVEDSDPGQDKSTPPDK